MNLKNYLTKSPQDRLTFFLNSLSITNRTPEYYVNWEKVERETKKFELELNTLNYLIGKKDIYSFPVHIAVFVRSDCRRTAPYGDGDHRPGFPDGHGVCHGQCAARGGRRGRTALYLQCDRGACNEREG